MLFIGKPMGRSIMISNRSIPNGIPKHIPKEWVKPFTMFSGWHVSSGKPT